VSVLYEARHRGSITYHVSVHNELPTYKAAEDGVTRKEAGVVDPPREVIFVYALEIDEGGVFLRNEKSAAFCAAQARRAPCLVVRERGV
jgi:hypothetical protein